MSPLKHILIGVGAVFTVSSLALSFAPLTAHEKISLGPNAARLQIVQRRLAIGLRDLAPPPLLGLVAQAAGVTAEEFDLALDAIISPAETAFWQSTTLSEPAEPPGRTVRAGGAVFVTIN